MLDYLMSIWDYLNSLNPGLTLSLMAYVGFVCRQIPEKIWNLIDQNFSVTSQITNDEQDSYYKASRWLFNVCPKLNNHIYETTQYREEDCNYKSLADGNYQYFLNWNTLIFIQKTKITNHGSESIKYELFIKMIGFSRDKYLAEYKRAIQAIEDKPNLEALIKGGVKYNNWIGIPKKYFKDIYLDIIPELKLILDKFIANKNTYIEHGITYKLGICFYGPGGVGKSILCRAIATYLKWDMVIIKNSGVNTCFDVDGEYNKVIVLEELDLYCNLNREENKPSIAKIMIDKSTENSTRFNLYPSEVSDSSSNQSIMLQNLLTFLDGLNSPNNCIIIATTNYIDRIDPILLRPGRFDYKFELTYMDRDKAIQMCNNFKVPVDSILTDDIEFPCSPAIVQNKILQYINS